MIGAAIPTGTQPATGGHAQGFFLQCFRVRFDPFNPALRVCPRGPSIDPSLEGKGLSLGQPVIFLRGHLKLWLAPEDGLVKQTMICGTRYDGGLPGITACHHGRTASHVQTTLDVIGIVSVTRKTFLFQQRVDLSSKKQLRSQEFCRR